jgi:hypothetical protein
MLYRRARKSDIPAMAAIRAGDWGTEEYWRKRSVQYLAYQLNPREALCSRVAPVCVWREKNRRLKRRTSDALLRWAHVTLPCNRIPPC